MSAADEADAAAEAGAAAAAAAAAAISGLPVSVKKVPEPKSEPKPEPPPAAEAKPAEAKPAVAKPKKGEEGMADLAALEGLLGLTDDADPTEAPAAPAAVKVEDAPIPVKLEEAPAKAVGMEDMEVNPTVIEAPRVDQLCEMCNGGHHEDQMILCDKCDNGYHMYCLIPPLKDVPTGDWFCPNCIAREKRATDIGFRPGKKYSLNDYSSMAKSFKNKWYAGSGGFAGFLPNWVSFRAANKRSRVSWKGLMALLITV